MRLVHFVNNLMFKGVGKSQHTPSLLLLELTVTAKHHDPNLNCDVDIKIVAPYVVEINKMIKYFAAKFIGQAILMGITLASGNYNLKVYFPDGTTEEYNLNEQVHDRSLTTETQGRREYQNIVQHLFSRTDVNLASVSSFVERISIRANKRKVDQDSEISLKFSSTVKNLEPTYSRKAIITATQEHKLLVDESLTEKLTKLFSEVIKNQHSHYNLEVCYPDGSRADFDLNEELELSIDPKLEVKAEPDTVSKQMFFKGYVNMPNTQPVMDKIVEPPSLNPVKGVRNLPVKPNLDAVEYVNRLKAQLR